MRKYFFKISAVFFLVVIFPTITNLCLENLLDLSIDVKAAQAAIPPMDNSEMKNFGDQVCKTEKDNVQKEMTSSVIFSTPINLGNLTRLSSEKPMTDSDGMNAQHDNSLLPCCTNNSHYGAVTISSFIDFGKDNIIPSFFYSEHQISKIVLPALVYYSPITAPPELSIVKTTVLRL